MQKIISFIIKVLNYFIGIGYGAHSLKNEVKNVKKKLKKAKVIIDVGANKGKYSSLILKYFNADIICLFEPSIYNYNLLIDKFKNNNNMFIFNLGLSDICISQNLYSNNEFGSGLASLSKRSLEYLNINFDYHETINLIRFDKFWHDNFNNSEIDLIKIDVEGHEMNVLNGIGSFIYKIKIIQFEFGGCNIDSKIFFRDFWNFFLIYEFDLFRISPFGLIKINNYSEELENFKTTNYLCFNKKYL
ncbi:MAG: FkbM family methyltransferase [Silvanigrellaceae bacterium]|nr:FkbM family methyltransferase [Silvanigrellaceae bacterium]